MSLKEIFEKYKLWIIWGAVVLAISAVIILILVSARRKQEENKSVTLIENPLQYDVSHRLFVDKDKITQKYPDSLEVFKIVNKNYHTDIDSFITLTKQSLVKSNIQSLLYTWVRGDTYVEYVSDTQNLFFRFEDRVQTGIDIKVNSQDSANDYLSRFYKKYFGREYEFLNVVIKNAGNRIRIEGNRNLNGYPLYTRGPNSYSDYLVIDANGALYEGNLALIEHTDTGVEKLSLVHVSNLQSAISNVDYPKEIFQNPASSNGDEIDFPEDPSGNEVDEINEELPVAARSELESVELVYYFSSTSFQQISPTFRILSKSNVNQDGVDIGIDLVIFANALDPERVYVPN